MAGLVRPVYRPQGHGRGAICHPEPFFGEGAGSPARAVPGPGLASRCDASIPIATQGNGARPKDPVPVRVHGGALGRLGEPQQSGVLQRVGGGFRDAHNRSKPAASGELSRGQVVGHAPTQVP